MVVRVCNEVLYRESISSGSFMIQNNISVLWQPSVRVLASSSSLIPIIKEFHATVLLVRLFHFNGNGTWQDFIHRFESYSCDTISLSHVALRVCGFFNVPQFYYMCKGLWDGAYGLSSLSEKTRKSNRLQMLLQRQHFLLSYLKTLSVGPAGVWTYGLPLSRPALIHWAIHLSIGLLGQFTSVGRETHFFTSSLAPRGPKRIGRAK